MSCKHVLSELKHQHLIAMQRDSRSTDRKRKFEALSTTLAISDGDTRHVTSVPTSTSMSSRPTRSSLVLANTNTNRKRHVDVEKTKLNGWSLCIRDCFAEPCLPGETTQERYRRLRKKAQERQQDPVWKQFYSQQAKSLNKTSKSKTVVAANCYGQNSGFICALQSCTDQGTPSCSVGPWGAGDTEYPISQNYVAEVLKQPQFIRTQSSDFRSRFGALVDDVPELPDNSVSHETFCMKLGGCYNALDGQQQQHVLDVLRTLRDLARMHRHRKRTDPALMMLLTKPRKNGDDDDTLALTGAGNHVLCYMVTQVTLSPLDVCLWQCTVCPRGVVTFCREVICYKSFSATLDSLVMANATHTYAQKMPKIQTMHEFAYAFRHSGFTEYIIRIMSQYEVTSLNSVCVVDADAHFTGIAPPSAQPRGDDIDDDDSNHDHDHHENAIQSCMDLLKASIGHEDKRKNKRTKRTQCVEPRAKPHKHKKPTELPPPPTASSGMPMEIDVSTAVSATVDEDITHSDLTILSAFSDDMEWVRVVVSNYKMTSELLTYS